MDDLTAKWVVPDSMQDDFDNIKTKYQVSPFMLFKDDKYVEPHFADGIIKNALVEIHFSLRHFHIRANDNNNKSSDTFTGLVKQVIVLKEGRERSTSGGYKRKNPFESPYRPAPATSTAFKTVTNLEPQVSAECVLKLFLISLQCRLRTKQPLKVLLSQTTSKLRYAA